MVVWRGVMPRFFLFLWPNLSPKHEVKTQNWFFGLLPIFACNFARKHVFMKIVRCKWFPPKGFTAIMLVWWLIVKPKVELTSRLINHEEIHSRQQKEMLVIFFLLWYGLEYLFRLAQYRNHQTAYRNISFEREAYANQFNLGYLTDRKFLAWTKYLRT